MTIKIYLDNPYLRQYKTRIRENVFKNNKFHIKTEHTLFYPNTGGQARDKGFINDLEVLDVYEENGDIIHIVSSQIKENEVLLYIDWQIRFDHMQQNTGQQILSWAFSQLLNAKTIGAFMDQDYVYIDVDLTDITEKEIENIEEFSNKMIYSNFSIHSFIDKSKLNGAYARNTGEIGLIKINNIEKYKDKIRVVYLCGNRAFKDYMEKSYTIKRLANFLNSKEEDLILTIEKKITD